MSFIKVHSADADWTEIRVNVDHIVAYMAPNENGNITIIQTDGVSQMILAEESPEEIDAMIEKCNK